MAGLLRALVLAVLAGAAATAAAAEIYKTVDENGNIVFTDQPGPDAEPVELKPLSVADPVKVTPRPVPAADQTQEKPVRYRVSLVSPTPDETLWGTAGNLPVQVSTRPALQPGHRVAVYLDGQQVDEMVGAVKQIGGIDRGTHTVSVAVLDDQGRTVSNTPSATFHMKQHSILLPTARPGLGFRPGG